MREGICQRGGSEAGGQRAACCTATIPLPCHDHRREQGHGGEASGRSTGTTSRGRQKKNDHPPWVPLFCARPWAALHGQAACSTMPSPTCPAGLKRAARSLFNHALRPPIRAGRDLRRRQKRMPERLARRVCGGGKMLDTRWIAVVLGCWPCWDLRGLLMTLAAAWAWRCRWRVGCCECY